MNKDVILRPLAEADLERVRQWRNSPEVSKYMYSENYISESDQVRWYTKIKDDTSCYYWIIEYDGKALGVASLTDINPTLDSCFWAFYLGDTSLRGCGIGAKTEYRVLSFVFDVLKLNKLRCEVLISNPQVICMHEKFGFRREAYYREHVKKNGGYLDVIGLAMLKKEWEQSKDYHYQRIYEK